MASGTWTYNYTVDSTGHTNDGTHSFVFTTTDVAGKTATTSRSVLVDTQAAVIAVANPAPASWQNVASYTVRGTADDGSGSGVMQVWTLVDATANDHTGDSIATITSGATWKLATGTVGWSYAWPLGAEENKKLWVKTLDNAGNWNASATVISFGYDATAPALAITAPGAYNTGFNITGTQSDAAAGVTSLQLKIDSGTLNPVTVAASWTYAVSAGTLGGLSEGAHTITVIAIDAAGNQTTQTASFNKDTTQPTISYSNISGSGGSVVQDASPQISGTFQDASGLAASATVTLERYSYATSSWSAVNGFNNQNLGISGSPTNFPWSLNLAAAALPDGQYRVSFVVPDTAVNANVKDTTAAPVTFYVSSSAPTGAISYPALGTFQRSAFPMVGTVSDFNKVSGVVAKIGSGSVDFSSGTTPAYAALDIASLDLVTDTFTTNQPHGLTVGDQVHVWGATLPATATGAISAATTYYVKTVPTSVTFTISASSGGPIVDFTMNGSAMIVSGSTISFYPSLSATLTNGSATIASTGHGLVADTIVFFAGTTLPQIGGVPVNPSTPYYVISTGLTADQFQVSTSKGGAAVTFSNAGVAVSVSSPNRAVKWMVASLPIGMPDGPLTAYVQVTANGTGKKTQLSRDFTLDSTAPTVAVTSPVSGSRTVGNLTINGTSTDPNASPSGVASVAQYQVGKNANLGNPASWINASGGAYSWSINLGLMNSYSNTTFATECDALGNDATGTNLWKLPIYYQTVDNAGNVGQLTTYFLILDPNGNVPVVLVTQPTQNGATFGGMVRVSGTATQPIWIHDVEVSIDPAGGSNFPASPVSVSISGNTLTSAAHPFTNGMMVFLSGTTAPKIGGTDVSATTAYFVMSAAANTFQVSATSGGAAVPFSFSGTGVTASTWGAATLTTQGNSVNWYYDVNTNNIYPQSGFTQGISVQVRAWNSPTPGGARGSISGVLPTPLTMTFNTTFPHFTNMKVGPDSNPANGVAYFSQITEGKQFYVTGTVSTSKGLSKLEQMEDSPLSGVRTQYDFTVNPASVANQSSAPFWSSTVTPPAQVAAGSFPHDGTSRILVTAVGSVTDWSSIGGPNPASVGTVFVPTGNGAALTGATALVSDTSGNFNYSIAVSIDSTQLFNNTTGVYSFDLRATDLTSGSPQVSSTTITVDEDNFYPSSTLSSGSSILGTTFKIQGSATDVGTNFGSIQGLRKVVVYLERGGQILDFTGGGPGRPGPARRP